jgi:hypothetical protein
VSSRPAWTIIASVSKRKKKLTDVIAEVGRTDTINQILRDYTLLKIT